MRVDAKRLMSTDPAPKAVQGDGCARSPLEGPSETASAAFIRRSCGALNDVSGRTRRPQRLKVRGEVGAHQRRGQDEGVAGQCDYVRAGGAGIRG
jgi:hypothetical protein